MEFNRDRFPSIIRPTCNEVARVIDEPYATKECAQLDDAIHACRVMLRAVPVGAERTNGLEKWAYLRIGADGELGFARELEDSAQGCARSLSDFIKNELIPRICEEAALYQKNSDTGSPMTAMPATKPKRKYVDKSGVLIHEFDYDSIDLGLKK